MPELVGPTCATTVSGSVRRNGRTISGSGTRRCAVAPLPALPAARPLLAAAVLPAGGHSELDLEEAAERDARADRADREADEDDDQRDGRERPGLDAGAGVETVGDPLEHDRLADQEQQHGGDASRATPQISPSSMNGPRTNQFVAPTSFITSISRFREKIESRIVFAIRSADEIRRTIVATRTQSRARARP